MMKSVANEFNTLRDFLIEIMNEYPETRNNDTLLYTTCCKKLGCNSINDIEELGLSVISIHKTRQLIQNKLGFCQPSDKVKELRNQRKFDIKQYMGKVKKAI